jgi:hypothetical protein
MILPKMPRRQLSFVEKSTELFPNASLRISMVWTLDLEYQPTANLSVARVGRLRENWSPAVAGSFPEIVPADGSRPVNAA